MIRLHFVQKRKLEKPNGRLITTPVSVEKKEVVDEGKEVAEEVTSTKNNKKRKKNNEMNTNEKIATAEAVLDAMAPEVKVVKKDRGLIERTESSKIILTEDNRQVLND